MATRARMRKDPRAASRARHIPPPRVNAGTYSLRDKSRPRAACCRQANRLAAERIRPAALVVFEAARRRYPRNITVWARAQAVNDKLYLVAHEVQWGHLDQKDLVEAERRAIALARRFVRRGY